MKFHHSCTAFFFATSTEGSWLKKQLDLHSHLSIPPFHFLWGEPKYPYALADRSLLLVQTGMGCKNAGKAADYAFRNFPIADAWIVGFCGGTQEGIRTGDTLIANSISGQNSEVLPPFSLQQKILSCINDKRFRSFQGKISTVEKALESSEEKLEWGEKTGSVGIAMEGLPIALKAREHSVPVMEVRTVLDTARDSFSFLSELAQSETEAQAFDFFKTLARKPKSLFELPSFLWKVRTAHRALNHFLQKWFEDEIIR